MRLFMRRLQNILTINMTMENNKKNECYNKLVLAIVLHENYRQKCQHWCNCTISSMSMPFRHDNVQFFRQIGSNISFQDLSNELGYTQDTFLK